MRFSTYILLLVMKFSFAVDLTIKTLTGRTVEIKNVSVDFADLNSIVFNKLNEGRGSFLRYCDRPDFRICYIWNGKQLDSDSWSCALEQEKITLHFIEKINWRQIRGRESETLDDRLVIARLVAERDRLKHENSVLQQENMQLKDTIEGLRRLGN